MPLGRTMKLKSPTHPSTVQPSLPPEHTQSIDKPIGYNDVGISTHTQKALHTHEDMSSPKQSIFSNKDTDFGRRAACDAVSLHSTCNIPQSDLNAHVSQIKKSTVALKTKCNTVFQEQTT